MRVVVARKDVMFSLYVGSRRPFPALSAPALLLLIRSSSCRLLVTPAAARYLSVYVCARASPLRQRRPESEQVEATQIMRIRDNIVRMYSMMTGQTQEQITIVRREKRSFSSAVALF